MGLYSCVTGCLAWSGLAVEPTECWVVPGLGDKVVTSRRAQANEHSVVSLPPVSSFPQWITAAPASPGDPQKQGGSSGPGFYLVTAFPWVPVHTRPCVCPPRKEFLFLSPVGFLSSSLTGFKSQMLWEILALMPGSQVGKPDMELRTPTPMGPPLQYNCFLICGLLTQWVQALILSQFHSSYCFIVASFLSLDVG